MTHNHPQTIACAELFGKTVYLVLHGLSPVAAVTDAVQTDSMIKEVRDAVHAGLDSRRMDTRQAIAEFGQMCEVEAALPATIHLLAKYEDNFKEALVENIMAGGDSAARGMLVGLVLGCFHGMSVIPEQWILDMIQYEELGRLIEAIER